MQFSPVLLFLSLAFAAVLPRQQYEVAVAKPNIDVGLAPQVEKYVDGSGPAITGEASGGITKRDYPTGAYEIAVAKPNVDVGLAPQVEKYIDGSGPAITGEGSGGISS